MAVVGMSRAEMVGPVIKRCTRCPRTFTRIEWSRLPCVGIMRAESLDEVSLELRNCPCQATLDIVLCRDAYGREEHTPDAANEYLCTRCGAPLCAGCGRAFDIMCDACDDPYEDDGR